MTVSTILDSVIAQWLCAAIMCISVTGCGPGEVQSKQNTGDQTGKVVLMADYTDFSDAVSSAGSVPATLLIGKVVAINADITTPATLALAFEGPGQLAVERGRLVTISGSVHASPTNIIFTGDGQVNVSRSVVHYVPWWGMTTGDKNDHAFDFSKIIRSINAAGGGTVNFPPGVYRIFNQENTPSRMPGSFMNVTGLTIVGHGATLEIDPANTYLYEQNNVSWFHFINSRDIFIDGFSGTGRNPLIILPGIFTGVAFAVFEQGCQNITIPSVRLYGGWTAAVITRRLPTDPESYISKGFNLGVIEVTGTIYGVNSQFSGEDMHIELLRTDGVYRSFFIYGTKHVKATIYSKNSRAAYDVPLAATDGVDLEDINIEYTDIDSTFPQITYGVLLTHSGHSKPTKIMDIKIKLNVKYASANQLGYAFSYRKQVDGSSPGIELSSALDIEDRGHTLRNLHVEGLVDGTPISGVPVAVGEPGTAWGAGENIYDIFLNDLHVTNNSQDQPIMTSLIMPALKGHIAQ